jgi:cell division septation protein DedD
MTTLLAAQFAQIDSSISATTAQITALQVKLSELQDYRQQLLSVEQACESALGQIGTALSMLNHVDPSQINTFKLAVDAQFGTDAIALLNPTTPEPTAPTPTAPEPTAPENETVIDVDAMATDTPAPAPTPATDTPEDIEKSLNKLSLPSFRKLAKSKNLDSRLNRATLTARLKVLVTKAELLAIS